MNADKKPDDLKKVFKSNYDVIIYFFELIKATKKWWLLPFLFVLSLLGMFVSLAGNSSLLPAIYAIF